MCSSEPSFIYRNQEVGGRSQEAGGRRQEAGGRSQESGGFERASFLACRGARLAPLHLR
ncbi:hypothetical protein V0288_04460 [Pannus brasiliensis CCIBt3594]|uniref:Uncharacterized protein n=1 Tax=Pannus brasiliensis CCIBt3594 TaxID=1427578 RepID=A0AAW9QUS8_9CHRO